MRHHVASDGVALLPLVLAAILASCTGDSTSATSADASAPPSTTEGGLNKPEDAAVEASPGLDATADEGPDPIPDAGADVVADAAPPIGSLSLTLDPSIDIDGDTVKATTITSVDLLDTKGSTRASATVSGAIAVVTFAGIAAGDYFLKVNGDADDLVPTRVDDPTRNVLQRVGTMLRASLIGPTDAPVYRVNTYSVGQGTSPVVAYSDGTALTPAEQPYVFVTFAPPKVEFKVLGTAAAISSLTPMLNAHVGNDVPFDAWLINTNGLDHHGDMFKADGGAAACAVCHWKMDIKPPMPAATKMGNGFCFHCHNGTGGSDDGFVDPSK